jgi:hypothetical protein
MGGCWLAGWLFAWWAALWLARSGRAKWGDGTSFCVVGWLAVCVLVGVCSSYARLNGWLIGLPGSATTSLFLPIAWLGFWPGLFSCKLSSYFVGPLAACQPTTSNQQPATLSQLSNAASLVSLAFSHCHPMTITALLKTCVHVIMIIIINFYHT